MADLYCDGGCIGRNPSPFGGTFAWCLVEQKQIKTSGSGYIRPKDFSGFTKISNNISELYAALEALSAVPKDWNGTLFTDSRITLFRLLGGKSFKGVPADLRRWCLDIRKEHKWCVSLLAGHPNRKSLENGFNERGFPVSKWNVYCDKECTRLSRLFMERRAG